MLRGMGPTETDEKFKAGLRRCSSYLEISPINHLSWSKDFFYDTRT